MRQGLVARDAVRGGLDTAVEAVVGIGELIKLAQRRDAYEGLEEALLEEDRDQEAAVERWVGMRLEVITREMRL